MPRLEAQLQTPNSSQVWLQFRKCEIVRSHFPCHRIETRVWDKAATVVQIFQPSCTVCLYEWAEGGNQGSENNLFEGSAGCIICTLADGWVGRGDPFNLDQLCFPNECQLRGVGQGGGGQICYWRSVCPSTIAFLQRAGQRGNESGRQLPLSDPPWWWGHTLSNFKLSKFWLIFSFVVMMIGSVGLQYWPLSVFCFDRVLLCFEKRAAGCFPIISRDQVFNFFKLSVAEKQDTPNILTKWIASKYISFKPKNQISWFVPLVQPCLRFVIDFICVQLMIQLDVWCLEASADLKLLVKVVWIKGDTELNMPREMTLHFFYVCEE